MSTEKPRTEAEILADWNALLAENQAADDQSDGWMERSAQRAEREAALLDEVHGRAEIPIEMARYAVGWAQLYLRRYAQDMRRA